MSANAIVDDLQTIVHEMTTRMQQLNNRLASYVCNQRIQHSNTT